MKIRKSELRKWLRFVFYGEPKTGKTTLAASLTRKPLLVSLDGGADSVPGLDVWTPKDWLELKDAKYPDEYDCIIIDTFGHAERLALAQLSREAGGHIRKWGGGFNAYSGELSSRLWAWLESLESLGKTIVVLAHQQLVDAADPDGGDVKRLSPLAREKNSRHTLLEWPDVIGRTYVDRKRAERDDAGRASGTMEYRLQLQASPGADAGGRLPLRDQLNDPAALIAQIKAAREQKK